MPEEFYSRVSAMRKYSALSILAFILIPALLYFLALSVVHMKFCAAAVFSLLILIIIFFLLKAKNEVKTNAKNLSPYAIEYFCVYTYFCSAEVVNYFHPPRFRSKKIPE